MFFGLLADAVLLLHLAFVAFAVLGGLLALRWRWLPWLHLPALGWAAFVEFSGRICPLTPLETVARTSAKALAGRAKRMIVSIADMTTVLARPFEACDEKAVGLVGHRAQQRAAAAGAPDALEHIVGGKG